MDMLNHYCGIDRDPRGVVALTICNAGSLNILGSLAINGLREGLTQLAAEPQIRVLVLKGGSEKSLIGGADIKEMAGLDQASAETFITDLRDLCEAVRVFPAPVIARLRSEPDFSVEMLPTGLFSGHGARPMDEGFAAYAWTNDQRIEKLSGQRFTSTYREKVLEAGGRFDSGPATLGLTAVSRTAF